MAETKKTPTTAPIIDVSPPGKSAPSDSSKPVLVSNRPLLKDPMMVSSDDTKPADSENAGQIMKAANIKADSVPVAEIPTIATDAPDTTDKPDDTAAEPKAPVPKNEPEPKTPKTDQAEITKPEPPAKGAEDSQDEDKSKDAKPGDDETKPGETAETQEDPDAVAAAEAAKQAEHDTNLQKLVDTKQYFMPINSVEKRRSQRFVALGIVLSVLLALAWADIALDAGLIHIGGVKPVTHFFNQQTVAASNTSSAPVITYKLYNAPFTKLAFHYPANWKFTSGGSTPELDNVGVNPPDNTINTTQSSSIFVTLFSPPAPPLASQASNTIEYIKYQKLTHQLGQNIYLSDVIFENSSGRFVLRSVLTNTNTAKAGDVLSSLNENFNYSTPLAQGSASFTITTIQVNSGGSNFSSLSDAQQFIQSSDYQQARSILLSTMAATK